MMTTRRRPNSTISTLYRRSLIHDDRHLKLDQ
jgi:hypothetical protein